MDKWTWTFLSMAVFGVMLMVVAAVLSFPGDNKRSQEKQAFLDNCARINGTVRYVPAPPSFSQDPKEIWCYAPDGKIAYRIQYYSGV